MKDTGNLKAEILAEWCGTEYLFRLTVGSILELENKCGAAFGVIFRRVSAGDYTINDLLNIVRLGLIGGGMSPSEAAKALQMHAFPERPLSELFVVARTVLAAAVLGFAVAPIAGKQKAAPSRRRSTPPQSTAPLQ